jgi:hypothetical protein
MHALLPELARGRHRAFVAEVRALAEAVERPPGSAEEFVAHTQLLLQLEGRRQEMQQRHDHVVAHYTLMQDFGVAMAQEDMEAVAGLDGEVCTGPVL